AGWDGRRLFPAKLAQRAEFLTKPSSYILPANFYRVLWTPACKALGIKDLSYHNLRHTFASKCLHRGATPQEVADWLGDTLEVFTRHYAHIIDDLKKDRRGLLARQDQDQARQDQESQESRPKLRIV